MPEEVLRRYFGYTQFRQGQRELIEAQLAGRDVFGIMPTGGGKSICYQVTAMLLPGITLVVSPLISLMKDQVMALKEAGIPAAFLNSSLSPEQITRVYGNLRRNLYKIVYIAPERLMTDRFLELAQELDISLLAVDEAHCISQWGQDFRPSYLKIPEFVALMPVRPVLAAFTATATERVRQDVERILGLREPLRLVTGFDRPNLFFEVRKPKNKTASLLSLLSRYPGGSGIIYCSTRRETEEVCQTLKDRGFSAACYHAGLEDSVRREAQEDFVFDRCQIMVATNAFGMGIDKSNVSFVIHYNMPKSLEAYYQEAGRAGRDGQRAECILLYSQKDVTTARYLIEHSVENDQLNREQRAAVMAQDYERLDTMLSYCKTDKCLRGSLLDYFGEAHQPVCGNCRNCLDTTQEQDVTRQAQMVFSCVQRMYRKLGYSLGAAQVCAVLKGSKKKRLIQLGLGELSTYGIMSDIPKEELHDLLTALEAQGYLHTDLQHGGIVLCEKARGVLFSGEKVSIRMKKNAMLAGRTEAAQPAAEGLMDALKRVRTELAAKERVPPYVVFNNAALEEMAQKLPSDPEEFLQISGVGRYKAEKYGEPFLRAIQAFKKEREHR